MSIRPKGDSKLYTRVEIKNLNSFRFIQKAIEYEVERQIEAWENGRYADEVYQETRLFDTQKGETKSMRGKEESADYRYFPDPDLLPLHIPQDLLDVRIPELPDEKRERYIRDYGLKAYDAHVLTGSLELVRYFEDMLTHNISPQNAVKWLTSELLGKLKGDIGIENSPVSSAQLAKIVARVEDGTISGKSGKEILEILFTKGGEVDALIESLGLKQVSDEGAILAVIDSVLAANADKVAEYKSGKEKLFGFFVGQVMKNAKGVNPASVNALLKQRLQ